MSNNQRGKIGDRWVEKVAASKWFGRHATGSVVLVNGTCVFHGTPAEATAFLKAIKVRAAKGSAKNT